MAVAIGTMLDVPVDGDRDKNQKQQTIRRRRRRPLLISPVPVQLRLFLIVLLLILSTGKTLPLLLPSSVTAFSLHTAAVGLEASPSKAVPLSLTAVRREISERKSPGRHLAGLIMNMNSDYDGDGGVDRASQSTTATAQSETTDAAPPPQPLLKGIENFRPVAGIPSGTIYRCASTDVLGEKLLQQQQRQQLLMQWTDADRFVLENAGLILDLRSDVERNDKQAQAWIDFVNSNNKSSNNSSNRNKKNDGDKSKSSTDESNLKISSQPSSSLSVRSLSSEDYTVISGNRGSSNVPNDENGPIIRSFRDDGNKSKQKTTTRTNGGIGSSCASRRHIVRVDVLNPTKFMSYVDDAWLSPLEVSWFKLISGTKLHSARMKALNERGLSGLNEAILESGRQYLCWSLKAITVYREENSINKNRNSTNRNTSSPAGQSDHDTKIVIHCVQGKDRTGMLSMLVQIILGVPDNVIIEDYYESNKGLDLLSTTTGPTSSSSDQQPSLSSSLSSSSSAAADVAVASTKKTSTTVEEGKLDRKKFKGTNREAMIITLDYIRSRYGSFDTYLDEIGFDNKWRKRLRSCLLADDTAQIQCRL